MVYRFVIDGVLPNMNDYSKAQRANRYAGATMKRSAQEKIGWCILQQLNGVKIESPVTIKYLWVEKNMVRDLDNISSFGHKVIQDALVAQGVLKDDGWKEIKGFTDEFAVDAKNPRIEVEIIEAQTQA